MLPSWPPRKPLRLAQMSLESIAVVLQLFTTIMAYLLRRLCHLQCPMVIRIRTNRDRKVLVKTIIRTTDRTETMTMMREEASASVRNVESAIIVKDIEKNMKAKVESLIEVACWVSRRTLRKRRKPEKRLMSAIEIAEKKIVKPVVSAQRRSASEEKGKSVKIENVVRRTASRVMVKSLTTRTKSLKSKVEF